MTNTDIIDQVLHHKKYLDRYLEREDADDKILYLLRKLDDLDISLEILANTRVGKTVNGYRKRTSSIGEKAQFLVNKWKSLLPEPPSQSPSVAKEKEQPVQFDLAKVKQEKQNRLNEKQNKFKAEDSGFFKSMEKNCKSNSIKKESSTNKVSIKKEKDEIAVKNFAQKLKEKKSSDDKKSVFDFLKSSVSSPDHKDNKNSSQNNSTSNDNHRTKRDKSADSIKHESKHKKKPPVEYSPASGSDSDDDLPKTVSHKSKAINGEIRLNFDDEEDFFQYLRDHKNSIMSNVFGDEWDYFKNYTNKVSRDASTECDLQHSNKHEISKKHSKHKENVNGYNNHERSSVKISKNQSQKLNKAISDDEESQNSKENSVHSDKMSEGEDSDAGGHSENESFSRKKKKHKLKNLTNKSSMDSDEENDELHSDSEFNSSSKKVDKLKSSKSTPESNISIKHDTIRMENFSDSEPEQKSSKSNANSKSAYDSDSGDEYKNSSKSESSKLEKPSKTITYDKDSPMKDTVKKSRSPSIDEEDNENNSESNFPDHSENEEPVHEKEHSEKLKKEKKHDKHEHSVRQSLSSPSENKSKKNHDSSETKHSKHSDSKTKDKSDEKIRPSSSLDKKSSHSKDINKESAKSEIASDEITFSDNPDEHNSNDGVDLDNDNGGIDALKGFSFEDALTLDSVNKNKLKKKSSQSSTPKRKSEDGTSQDLKSVVPTVPVPSKKIKLSSTDILASIPDYQVTEPVQEKKPKKIEKSNALSLEEVTQRSYNRIGVFAGRKNQIKAVTTLYSLCIQTVTDNIDLLEDVGGIPYFIMKPIFTKCSPEQLYNIEYYNPQFMKDTDELWRTHSQVTFKNVTKDVYENWREYYLRLFDEREQKFKNLSSKISSSYANAAPVRATKLAYVDSHAKAPRTVLQAQRKFGTAGTTKKQNPLAKLSSRPEKRIKEPIPDIPSTPTRPDKRVAPMMQQSMKSLQAMRYFKK